MVQGKVQSVPNKKYYDMSFYEDVDYIDDVEWIRKFFFDIKHSFPIHAWNKLLKRAFVMDNQLFFEEGLIHEDELWTFYVVRHLQKIGFCHQTTIIHYLTSGSIMRTITKEESAPHWAVIFDEISRNIGKENDSEFEYYLKRFVFWYKDFYKQPSYKKLYGYFLRTAFSKGYFYYFFMLILLRAFLFLGRGKNLIELFILKR